MLKKPQKHFLEKDDSGGSCAAVDKQTHGCHDTGLHSNMCVCTVATLLLLSHYARF